MDLMRDIFEMAATQVCGNCGQTMSGNHFYRKVKGQNVRFCKGSALQAAKAAGLTPKGNVSFPAGGQPPTSSTPSSGTSQNTQQPQQPQQPQPQSGGQPAPTQRSSQSSTPVRPDTSGDGKISRAELEEWLETIGVSSDQYEVKDGRINVTGSVVIDEDYEYIPLPFGTITGSFVVQSTELNTFKNFPRVIGGALVVAYSSVSSLEGLEVERAGTVSFSLENDELKDIRKIHKHIKRIDNKLELDFVSVYLGGMGAMLIDGIKEIDFNNHKVNNIFAKYLVQDDPDIFDLQEELIDAGYQGFARL